MIKGLNYSKIYLFLDNDEAGFATKGFFELGLESQIVDKSDLYSGYTDYNEMWIKK